MYANISHLSPKQTHPARLDAAALLGRLALVVVFVLVLLVVLVQLVVVAQRCRGVVVAQGLVLQLHHVHHRLGRVLLLKLLLVHV